MTEGRSGEAPPQEPVVPSYPEIQRLLETEDFHRLDGNLEEAYAALLKVSKEGGLKKARDARKALKAIDKVRDLFKELIRLKHEAMQQAAGGVTGPQGKK